MQYTRLKDIEISRFGLGTKRMPITDASRVDRLDYEIAREIADAATAAGVNFADTSYSNHKGEAEDFLGNYNADPERSAIHVATSYFEMVDPRFEYVFNKQLKKLGTSCIEFYTLEGVCDLNQERDIDSGAVDFLFEQREAGTINCLGFSSDLSAENIATYAKRYPWDYIRMQVNYCDWFTKNGAEKYQAATEAGLPIVAHGALRTGCRSTLRPEALKVLKEANSNRSSIDWALRFVKSLDAVATVTCNMHSVREVEENTGVFSDDKTLTADEMEVLCACAQAQLPRRK